MTGSSTTQGIKTVLAPQTDESYDVGFEPDGNVLGLLQDR